MALRLQHTNNFPDPSLNPALYTWDFAMSRVFNHFFTLALLQKILWKESIPDFENSNKSMKDILFFLNWLFDIGHTATISSYGHQSLSIFEENDTGLWNMHWSNYGNLNWIFRSFLKCSFLGKGLFIVNHFRIPDNLVYAHFGGRKDGNTLARTSKNCWTPPCFWTESESGPFFKTWDPIPESAMNKLNLFVASILAFRDAMHFDVWHNICQRPTKDWHYKQWMVLLNSAVANLLAKSDLSNARGCSPTGWSAM